MATFTSRTLRRSELTVPRSASSDENFPRVYEPGGGDPLSSEALGRLLDANKAAIRADVVKHGGVLLRGCGVQTPAEFEAVIRRLGYALMEDYTPADVRRTQVAGLTFTAADAPKWHFIAPHHEQCYSNRRPGIICFYADKAPDPGTGGETPIYDTRHCLSDMPPDDLAAMRQPTKHGRLYANAKSAPTLKKRFTVWLFDTMVRWFALPLPNLQHHPPWQNVFHTDDPEKAKAYVATMQGMELSFTDSGDAVYNCVTPNVVRHPVTGDERFVFASSAYSASNSRECWRIVDTLVRGSLLPFWLRQRAAQLLQWLLLWGSYTYVTPLADGTPNPLGARPYMAYWAHAVLFPWRRGDVLILDNVSAMHARMPCTDMKRRILTAIADPYTATAP